MYKKGLVLEGGALRGLFTAGVMDVLMEHGVSFDGLVGVSAGAAFGCNYKSRQAGRVIRYNKRFAHEWRYCSWRSWFTTGDIFGAEYCYHYLPEHLDVFDTKTFEMNPMEFYAVCTDVQTGDVWTEFYKILNGDKNTAISSMRPNAGIVWTLPDGNVIGSSTQTTAPQPETTTPQPETTAPQPETTAPGPEIADPPVVTSPTGDPLGTTSTAGYSNDLFGFSYLLPAGWIQANQDQLVTLTAGAEPDERGCGERSLLHGSRRPVPDPGGCKGDSQ